MHNKGGGGNSNDNVTVEQLEEVIKIGDNARKECIKFLDWFVTTSDPSLPDLSDEEAFVKNQEINLGLVPDPMPDASASFIRDHPCHQPYTQAAETGQLKTDYSKLYTTV